MTFTVRARYSFVRATADWGPVVPSEDSHASEYVSACDARRAYISGFSGSAGVAIVTPDKAALSTDGRYFNQAEKQLDGNLWTLLKTGLQDVPTWQEWTATQAEEGKVVGVDPTVISSSDARKLAEKIKKRGGHALRPVEENLVLLHLSLCCHSFGVYRGSPSTDQRDLEVKISGPKHSHVGQFQECTQGQETKAFHEDQNLLSKHPADFRLVPRSGVTISDIPSASTVMAKVTDYEPLDRSRLG